MTIGKKSAHTKAHLWTGRILQGTLAIMLAVGAMNNVLKTPVALSNAAVLGYKETTLLPLALGVLLYIISRTAILGAVVLTAWLGGAVATDVIHGDGPLVLMMPVIFGCLIWAALWLRGVSVRCIVPIKE